MPGQRDSVFGLEVAEAFLDGVAGALLAGVGYIVMGYGGCPGNRVDRHYMAMGFRVKIQLDGHLTVALGEILEALEFVAIDVLAADGIELYPAMVQVEESPVGGERSS